VRLTYFRMVKPVASKILRLENHYFLYRDTMVTRLSLAHQLDRQPLFCAVMTPKTARPRLINAAMIMTTKRIAALATNWFHST
jgi:hypothetical protein